MIGLGGIAAILPHHGRGDSRYVKADFRQCPAEQAVLFIAPTTSSVSDNLLVSGIDVGGHRSAELHIQVFKRDSADMMSEYTVQDINIGMAGPRVANPSKVIS